MSTKDLQDIIAQYRSKEPLGLATVVRVTGSAYRRPGARMLCFSDGSHAGTISGGCLESDVKERCRLVAELNAAELVRYQVSFDDDPVVGLNLGCSGAIDVLIQPVGQLSYLNYLQEGFTKRNSQVLATIISATPNLQSDVGSCMLVDPLHSNIKNEAVKTKLARLLNSVATTVVSTEMLELDGAEIFVDRIQPPIRLVIFGGGDDAIAVSKIASVLGWETVVVDRRAALLSKERFPDAKRTRVKSFEVIPTDGLIDQFSVCIIMTHNYLDDLNLLEKLLPSITRYVGVLGPKRRTLRLLEELACTSDPPDQSQIAKLFAPVGLNIGAETPEEIALSIVSEILAVLSKQSAGFLRDKKGPIHNTSNISTQSQSNVTPRGDKLSCPSP